MAPPACESFERLLVISTKPADLNTAFAIRQVDFDPQPCPSTYRIDASPTSTVDLHWSRASRYSSHQLDRSSKETPPLSGSSTSFDLIDNDSPRCLKGFATRFRDSLNSGTLALHWTDHRPGMSPYSLSTDDHRYRDNNKQWDDTNAESNAEIRSALMDSLQELKDIEGVWYEDGFELQRTCHQWEVTFSKVVNQVIDFYVSLFASCFTGDNCLTSLTTT
ncbi:hypothetical protein QFC21_003710 [Naganishia friedmannii]|uniref:Uncharacterized protein n=1 Tax=Naganishia friedmannii TaxID=89922 RepID=A0ACC2VP51_9TREE|nr:hypothetical protein QFC21_003710 [Naganishia friedmannii]